MLPCCRALRTAPLRIGPGRETREGAATESGGGVVPCGVLGLGLGELGSLLALDGLPRFRRRNLLLLAR
eukprot:COSAG04_NODE_6742_length_1265_cov_1.244425_1_plen_68_part_10